MGMALVRPGDARGRAGRGHVTAPAQDIEFMVSPIATTSRATGFVEHLKLPHYVDFQSELETDPSHAPRTWQAGRQGAMPE